ncbi:MAG: class II aldolase/adducin family protein [Bacteroidota bacterium]
MDEGYIKFRPSWEKSAPLSNAKISELIHWRQACYEKKWIGMYDNGIGYGNISIRNSAGSTFYITGSATGGIAQLDVQSIAEVIQVNAEQNSLSCRGPIVASSESMSHAAVYQELGWVQGVIHIHHQELWNKALHQLPTTDANAPYGSPEMVVSITELLTTTDLPSQGIFVMEGHEEGIFAFGKDLAAAFSVLENALNRFL